MRAVFFVPLLGLVLACAASDPTESAPREEVAPSQPVPSGGGDTKADAGQAEESDAGPPKNECKLAQLNEPASVAVTFHTLAPPSVAPAAMSGGTLDGAYIVDAATVYLPAGSGGLANPALSSGTVRAWAIFEGTNYRIHLMAKLTIDTVVGPQAQGVDNASQGGFTASGATLTLDHACDTALGDEADYTFTDDGSGRATILVKTSSPYGDTYMQLDAAKH